MWGISEFAGGCFDPVNQLRGNPFGSAQDTRSGSYRHARFVGYIFKARPAVAISWFHELAVSLESFGLSFSQIFPNIITLFLRCQWLQSKYQGFCKVRLVRR